MDIIIFIIWGFTKILDKWGILGLIGIMVVLAMLGAR